MLAGLRARGLRLAVAESCTAGLVGASLAAIPGSSDVLMGGVLAYANSVKQQLLGVSDEILARHGAVSAECAAAMAAGARAATGAGVGISVTGVAGPGGGTPQKPVGLVYLHVSGPGVEEGRELHAAGRPLAGARARSGRRAAPRAHRFVTLVTPRAVAAYPAR